MGPLNAPSRILSFHLISPIRWSHDKAVHKVHTGTSKKFGAFWNSILRLLSYVLRVGALQPQHIESARVIETSHIHDIRHGCKSMACKSEQQNFQDQQF